MPTVSPGGVLDRLRSTALDLVSLVSGTDPARLGHAAGPGAWSAATVVGHLADAELVYSVRLRMVLTADRPWLVGFAEEAWVTRFGPLDPDVREALHRWRVLRDANVRLFASLGEHEWAREGVHEERGTLTMAGLAELMVSHDRDHLDQIRGVLASA